MKLFYNISYKLVYIGVLLFALTVFAKEGIRNGPTEKPVTTKESATADKAYTHASGRSIRVVESRTNSESISEGPLGRVVETFTLQEESICPVVFTAKVGSDKLPVVAGIEQWELMTPIVIDHSSDEFIWFVILNREACLTMAEYDGYLGSTMKEMLALPRKVRSKILKTTGTCTVEVDGKSSERPCVVPLGHHRASAGADIFFPHNLAGRADINFKRHSNGKLQPRHPVAKTKKIEEK